MAKRKKDDLSIIHMQAKMLNRIIEDIIVAVSTIAPKIRARLLAGSGLTALEEELLKLGVKDKAVLVRNWMDNLINNLESCEKIKKELEEKEKAEKKKDPK